jgi:hypothetical protein
MSASESWGICKPAGTAVLMLWVVQASLEVCCHFLVTQWSPHLFCIQRSGRASRALGQVRVPRVLSCTCRPHQHESDKHMVQILNVVIKSYMLLMSSHTWLSALHRRGNPSTPLDRMTPSLSMPRTKRSVPQCKNGVEIPHRRLRCPPVCCHQHHTTSPS